MNKTIKLESAWRRAVLALAGFVCLTATFFFVKWCFANAIAARAPLKEVAELSVDLSPNDPQTHYALAVLTETSFLLEDLPKSLAAFERATALAPSDFRLWLELGKSRERNGDAAGAELALKKSLALAPNYAEVQWRLGNVLLRRGKTEEAFDEMRKAAESSNVYSAAFMKTLWGISGGDLESVKRHLGASIVLNSKLALSLAYQKRYDEALELWNSLPAGEKKTLLKTTGEELAGLMLAAKNYRAVLLIQQSVAEQTEAETFAPGKIFNGGFESEVRRGQANVFDWQIADGAQPQIGFDDREKLGGSRSLVVIFNSPTGKDFRPVSQTIVVEAKRKYVFESFYKSDLKTIATVHWEIIDASTDKILATTAGAAAAVGWTPLKTEFVTAETTQAVTVRLGRETCKSLLCPISGKIWFDDFSLR